jgi:hypothetical protein
MAKYSASIFELARRGAAHRYEELTAELSALVRQFPDLVRGSQEVMRRGRRAIRAAAKELQPRKRAAMPPAARTAVSARMKKYWAARRRAAAKKST